MFDSINLRAAALGFGLPFLLVPPQADGSLSIEDCAHALASYRYDLPDTTPIPDLIIFTAVAFAAPEAVSVAFAAPDLASVTFQPE